eukprot:gb/GFBE01030136.1/.p1 GENE.gb/GFBE01030136.1/~~gb/GFBE01030136.1/.p1  ORF type:complete len:132 (+),score=14.29 gb/GFBE01030136.1/:1-396(+)
MFTSKEELARIRSEMFSADQAVGKYLKKVGRNGRGCTQGSLYIVRAVDAMPADLPELPPKLQESYDTMRSTTMGFASPTSSPSRSMALSRNNSAPGGLLPQMSQTCTVTSPTMNRHFNYSYPRSIFKDFKS